MVGCTQRSRANGHADGNGATAYLAERLERLGVDTAGGRLDRCWLFRGPLHRGVSVRFNVADGHVSGTRFVWALARGVLYVVYTRPGPSRPTSALNGSSKAR